MAPPGETVDDMPTTEIVGVYVDSYKNLKNLWLGWSCGLVLVGGNGAGKSNLLECLALLMGNSATRALVAKRVPAEQPFDISAVVTENERVMLLAPELCIPLVTGAEGSKSSPPASGNN